MQNPKYTLDLSGVGQIAPGDLNRFWETLTCGVPGSSSRSNKIWKLPDGLQWLWIGKVPGRPGLFFVVNPYPSQWVRHNASFQHIESGTGLRDKAIEFFTDCPAELDDDSDFGPLSLDGQKARLERLVNDCGLLPPTMVIHSGGKSLHFHWVICATRDKELWIRIVHALVALLDSDPVATNAGRKMRVGGATDSGRIQSLLYANPTPYDSARLLENVLETCRIEGIEDPDVAFEALSKASSNKKKIPQIEDQEEAKKLLEVVLRVRKTKALTDEDRAALDKCSTRREGKPSGYAGVPSSGSTRMDGETIIEVAGVGTDTAEGWFRALSVEQRHSGVHSPFREDRNPSCGILRTDWGLVLSDFGTGELFWFKPALVGSFDETTEMEGVEWI